MPSDSAVSRFVTENGYASIFALQQDERSLSSSAQAPATIGSPRRRDRVTAAAIGSSAGGRARTRSAFPISADAAP